MEQDDRPEALNVAITAPSYLQDFDLAVDALRAGIGHLMHDGVDDPPQTLLDPFGNSLDRVQATSHRPSIPFHPCLSRPTAAAVAP